jgi:hypothetical protein
MKYAVYSTRGDHWSFESRERFPIPESEWQKYLASDSEFRPAGLAQAMSQGGVGEPITLERDGHWEWIGHPTAIDDLPTFQYLRAGLIARAPDEHTLEKANRVAIALQARVISDDYEIL